MFTGTYDPIETNISVIQRTFSDTYSIHIKCLFRMATQAKGVLLTFMYLNENDEIDFSKSFYFPVELSLILQGINRDILQGNYRVLLFYIENDYHIQYNGLPVTISTVSVPGMDMC